MDVSSVINMNTMFYGATVFNGDISEWDVSSVTNMSYMFFGAQRSMAIFPNGMSLVTNASNVRSETAFNGDISEWDVSSVTDMNTMFAKHSVQCI
jgi:surface protein